MSNAAWIKSAKGGSTIVLVLEKGLFEKVSKFVARDFQEFQDEPNRCVFPEFDGFQTAPIERIEVISGYKNPITAILSNLSGWHFIRPRKYVYHATTEGLRLIAMHGDPHRAYASL